MTHSELEPEASATAEHVVREEDLATAFTPAPSDAFPRVFATARMIALMEVAAARILEPLLAAGEKSVGVNVEATHTAATPPGARVQAHARFLGRDGKFYTFEVWAEDEAGEIGRGRHSRAIIDEKRLEASAAKRGKELKSGKPA